MNNGRWNLSAKKRKTTNKKIFAARRENSNHDFELINNYLATISDKMKTQAIKQTSPTPLLDTLEHVLLPSYKPPILLHKEDWQAVLFFLKKYKKQLQTFNAYRRELERLLQWSWLEAVKK